MTKVVAIVNQKGGTGKTTTAVNLGAGFGRLLGTDKTLLIDNDPQANTTLTFLGPDVAFGGRRPDRFTILDVYEEATPVANAIYAVDLTEIPSLFPASCLHVLPSQIELAAIETSLNTGLTGLFILRNALRKLGDRYDLILIDCPANLGAFTMSALLACNSLVVPVIPGQYEFAGLRSLMATIEKVKEFNPHVQISAVIPTRIKRTNVTKNALADLESFFSEFGIPVLESVQDRVAIEESLFAGEDIFQYAPTSPSAAQYGAVLQSLVHLLGI